ncbi:alcohol dehydrogenase catalytic domain-containing protein [Haloarchaeobius sp. FL176]|uniref:alcohol dehydrogenase catalytic domain-containing protein n=1 Tax=Haloarchaeobius sp. FL176 TaxID=2967129 RepID=UPI0034E938FD
MPPGVPGHEFAGVVESVGEGVDPTRIDADVGESLSLDGVADYHRRLRRGETSGMGVLKP